MDKNAKRAIMSSFAAGASLLTSLPAHAENLGPISYSKFTELVNNDKVTKLLLTLDKPSIFETKNGDIGAVQMIYGDPKIYDSLYAHGVEIL